MRFGWELRPRAGSLAWALEGVGWPAEDEAGSRRTESGMLGEGGNGGGAHGGRVGWLFEVF